MIPNSSSAPHFMDQKPFIHDTVLYRIPVYNLAVGVHLSASLVIIIKASQDLRTHII